MKPSLLLLAAELLELASESYSNHGCNDYEVADTPDIREWLIKCEIKNDKTLNRKEASESIQAIGF